MPKANLEMEFKKIIWMFVFILVAGFVSAAAPTQPTTITDDNAIFVSAPTLMCSGSTDADGDDINITFFEIGSSIIDPAFYNVTCLQDWCNPNVSQFPDASGGNNWMGIDVSPRGTWLAVAGTSSVNGICEKGEGTAYYENTTNQNWGTHKAACDNLNGSDPEGWHLAVIQSSDENALVADLCTDASFCYIGGYSYASGTDWVWRYNQTLNSTLQNSSNTSFDWNTLTAGTSGNWSCQACDDTGACSSGTFGRIAYHLNVSSCDITDGNLALNLTHRDEEDTTLLLNSSTDIDLNLSTNWDEATFNLGLTNNWTYGICVAPSGNPINITGLVDYTPENASHSFARQYYFDDNQITGATPQHIDLYSLADDLATAVTFQAIRFAQPVENILIHLQRYDPATGVYRLVSMAQTSSSGTDVIYLRLTDAFYRVFGFEDGTTVHSTGAIHITDTTYEIDLSGTSGGSSTNFTDVWQNFGNIAWNITWNNVSNLTTLTATDSSGAATSMCLRVNKLSLNDTRNICYECATTASVTISCNLSGTGDGVYTSDFIAYNNDAWRLLGGIVIEIGSTLADLIGLDGIFYAFIFIGMMAFAVLYSPALAVLMTTAGLIISVMIGFIEVPIAAIVGIIFVGVLFAIKLKR